MTRTAKENMEWWLNRFEFVTWDRFVESKHHIQFYGWIDREDNYKDFILLIFTQQTGKVDYFVSSSHARHDQILEILGKQINNFPCQRVEGSFKILHKVMIQ